MILNIPMKLRNFLVEFRDEGEVIASLGQARLIKYLDGKYKLGGGSREDRLAAKE
jgi:hypothetical protein